MKKPAVLISIFLFLITASQLTAQKTSARESNDIKGIVKAFESGEALVAANVFLIGSSRGTTTNPDGYFILPDVKTGTCTLKVSYIGYFTKEIIYENIPGKEKFLEVTLSTKSYKSGDVLIVAEKYKIWKTSENVSQLTVSPKQLSVLPNLGEVDIFRSLQLLPGISGVNDGSSGLYVRGGTPDQNLVLLDGMTVYHVDHFFGFFSAFNSDAIKDVQVYKGGFPSKYGGRLSSVIDLTGKTGNVNDFELKLGANLLSANALMEIPLWNKGSFVLSARRSYADFIESSMYNTIYDFLTGGDETPEQQMRGRFMMQEEERPSFYFYDINAKLSYQFGSKDFVSISFYNGEDYLDESQDPEEFEDTGGDIRQNFGGRTDKNLTNWGNLGSSVKWSRQWGDRFYSNLLFAASKYYSLRNQEIGFEQVAADTSGFAANNFKQIEDNNIMDYTLRLDNEWTFSKDHKLEFGFWSSSVSTDFNFTINDTTTIIDRSSKAFQASAYLQDNWQVTERLFFNLGARTTYYNNTAKFYLEPRISFNYRLTDLLKLKGAWGLHYQFINQITNENVLEGSRDFWLVADKIFNPGFSEHYILGLEFETEDYLLSVEGYYKSLENLLEFTQRIVRNPRNIGGDASNYESNFFVGDGISKGLEFLIQKKMGALNGWISYTLGKVDQTFPGFNEGKTFSASHDRRHEIKVIGAYTAGNWSFSAAWVFASGQAYTAPESQYYIEMLDGENFSYTHVSDKNAYRLPDYHRLDVSAAYKFKNKNLDGEFGLSVFNLYNNENVWYRKYDLDEAPVTVTDVSMLGITPTVFVKFNF